MRKIHKRAVVLTACILLVACGDNATSIDQAGSPTPKTGPEITLAGFDFAESSTLTEIYAQALRADGYNVRTRLKLGTRELVQPALQKGDIDFVVEYLGSSLEFLNEGAGEATADTAATLEKYRSRLATHELLPMSPAPAQNRNEIVVTKNTAEEHSLTKISDLAPIADRLVFGGPPECPERPKCLVGLKKTYGLAFRSFKPLDVGGPLTVTALDGDEVQVALLFTTTGAIEQKGFIALEDDKGLQSADNIVPVVRKEVVDAYGAELTELIDSISAKLTDQELRKLNLATDVERKDSDDAARDWLVANGFIQS